MATVNYYKRSVDAGNGTQYVELIGDRIVRQWLGARQGYYTGSGNPELVGQAKAAMRGYGFRKVSKRERETLLMEV